MQRYFMRCFKCLTEYVVIMFYPKSFRHWYADKGMDESEFTEGDTWQKKGETHEEEYEYDVQS